MSRSFKLLFILFMPLTFWLAGCVPSEPRKSISLPTGAKVYRATCSDNYYRFNNNYRRNHGFNRRSREARSDCRRKATRLCQRKNLHAWQIGGGYLGYYRSSYRIVFTCLTASQIKKARRHH